MKHNSIALLKSSPPIRRTLSAISIVLSLVFTIAALGVDVGSSFTYQGQLRRNGSAYNGTCNFQFSLWDAASGGSQSPTTTQSINNVSVVNGLFTVVLDFGGDAFRGDARWLGTSVQCSGDGGFTALDPRQPITATPYAHSLRPGTKIMMMNDGGINPAIWVENSTTASIAVFGRNFGSGGTGVRGDSWGGGIGVHGDGATGVKGTGDRGVYGLSFTAAGSGVYGENTGGGFAGKFVGPVDVAGPLTVNVSGAVGVFGNTTSSSGSGVQGTANGNNAAGVYGVNSIGPGVWGRSTGSGSGVYGENTSGGLAGRFNGPVSIQGTLTKSAGTFRIDHPLDPANKFLSHSFVESPDMMNMYNGNVTTDASGSATVTLPTYFSALNRDFRYQLTVLGQFAQAIVSKEIAGNSFEIQTDKPGVKVSWQITGIRQDAYAKAKPIVVEEFKPAEQQGLYLFPAGFGAGEEKSIGHSSQPTTAPGSRQSTGAGPSSQASK